jgi:hypothetical protein
MRQSLRFSLITVLALTAACSRDVQPDAELARDLALVNQAPANPQFQDTALAAAPEPRPAARPPVVAQRPSAPARERAVTTTPRPRPRPVEPPVVTRVDAPAPEPAPAPAPAARFKGFNAGTSFAMATKGPVCTNNLPGDKIVATISETVIGENGAVIPAGTSVVLEVASVTSGSSSENAQLALRVRSIVVNDEALSAEGNVAILSEMQRQQRPGSSSADKKKVIGGAVAGAIIGQIMGKDTRSTVIGAAAGGAAGAAAAAASRKYDTCLPAGSTVRFTSSQQIALG